MAEKNGFENEQRCVGKPISIVQEQKESRCGSPPIAPLPARSVKPTTPSFMSIGYFSLRRTISLSAVTTSTLTILGLPLRFETSPSSSVEVWLVDGDMGELVEDGVMGDDMAVSPPTYGLLEKKDRTTLTSVRLASERRRVSSVRGMSARRASSAVEGASGEAEIEAATSAVTGDGRAPTPMKWSELGTGKCESQATTLASRAVQAHCWMR